MSKISQDRTGDCTTYTVRNRRSRNILATNVQLGATRSAQRKRLVGRDSLESGTGLWIAPCEAIHTFGMLASIDAVFLERDFRVRSLRPRLRPFKIALCFPAYSVLELPAGTIKRSATVIGDYFDFLANLEVEEQSSAA